MTESKPLTLHQIAREVVREYGSMASYSEAIVELGAKPLRVKALNKAE